jgi:hypothetical protein
MVHLTSAFDLVAAAEIVVREAGGRTYKGVAPVGLQRRHPLDNVLALIYLADVILNLILQFLNVPPRCIPVKESFSEHSLLHESLPAESLDFSLKLIGVLTLTI